MPELSRCAVHTITNRPWSTEECIRRYAAAGHGGITFWRYSFDGRDPAHVGRQARDAGLSVVAVARGGFFTADDWWDDNRRAIEETAAVGAPQLVLVCGSRPKVPLEDVRAEIAEKIAHLLPEARAAGVSLAIEPLHPMYAGDRSAINTVGQALELCDALGSPLGLGIALDVYHTWWDPDLELGIQLAGAKGRLLSFHVCDWMVPTTDLLNDRGLMGEGCIDIPRLRHMVEAAGFTGFCEVEIFSHRWWGEDQAAYLEKISAAFQSAV